jgi:hypothetical protein
MYDDGMCRAQKLSSVSACALATLGINNAISIANMDNAVILFISLSFIGKNKIKLQ